VQLSNPEPARSGATLGGMSNPVEKAVETAVAAPKTVARGFKSRPIVWALIIGGVILAALVFRNQIRAGLKSLEKVPIIGGVAGWIVKVTAAFALIALGQSDAFAAGAQVAHESGGGVLTIVGILLGAVALGMGWAFPTPLHFDLKNDGSNTQIALTPGTQEQQAAFTIQGVRGYVGTAFMRATALAGRLRVGVDQPASGGSAIDWDQLPRVIAGLQIESKHFGTLLNKESSGGPALKHLIEFIGQGYAYGDYARAQISSADGDTAVDLYFCVPFAQGWLVRPHDTTPWVGWLDKTIVTFYLNTTTALDSVSTGAVIEATCNVQMWLEYHLDNDIEIPAIPVWQRYQRAAAGGNEVILEGVGLQKSMQKVEQYDRIAGVYDHGDVAGFQGADGPDNVTEYYCPALGIDRTVHVDAFFRIFRAYCIKRATHVGGRGNNALHDGSGNPETMAGGGNSGMNTSTAMYIPVRSPAPASEITKLPKFAGDLPITKRYTTAPSSGNHTFHVLSIRELTNQARGELLARAGLSGAKLTKKLADGSSIQDIADFGPNGDPAKYNNARRFRGLPDHIPRQGV